MMWYGEFRRHGQDGKAENWSRASIQPQLTQERANADCKAVLDNNRHDGHRLEFRTVADDERGSVYQESKPPHGWRMRWTDATW